MAHVDVTADGGRGRGHSLGIVDGAGDHSQREWATPRGDHAVGNGSTTAAGGDARRRSDPSVPALFLFKTLQKTKKLFGQNAPKQLKKP